MAAKNSIQKWLVAFVWRRRQVVSETEAGIVYGMWETIVRSIQVECGEFPDYNLLEGTIRSSDSNIEPKDAIEITAVSQLPDGWGREGTPVVPVTAKS